MLRSERWKDDDEEEEVIYSDDQSSSESHEEDGEWDVEWDKMLCVDEYGEDDGKDNNDGVALSSEEDDFNDLELHAVDEYGEATSSKEEERRKRDQESRRDSHHKSEQKKDGSVWSQWIGREEEEEEDKEDRMKDAEKKKEERMKEAEKKKEARMKEAEKKKEERKKEAEKKKEGRMKEAEREEWRKKERRRDERREDTLAEMVLRGEMSAKEAAKSTMSARRERGGSPSRRRDSRRLPSPPFPLSKKKKEEERRRRDRDREEEELRRGGKRDESPLRTKVKEWRREMSPSRVYRERMKNPGEKATKPMKWNEMERERESPHALPSMKMTKIKISGANGVELGVRRSPPSRKMRDRSPPLPPSPLPSLPPATSSFGPHRRERSPRREKSREMRRDELPPLPMDRTIPIVPKSMMERIGREGDEKMKEVRKKEWKGEEEKKTEEKTWKETIEDKKEEEEKARKKASDMEEEKTTERKRKHAPIVWNEESDAKKVHRSIGHVNGLSVFERRKKEEDKKAESAFITTVLVPPSMRSRIAISSDVSSLNGRVRILPMQAERESAKRICTIEVPSQSREIIRTIVNEEAVKTSLKTKERKMVVEVMKEEDEEEEGQLMEEEEYIDDDEGGWLSSSLDTVRLGGRQAHAACSDSEGEAGGRFQRRSLDSKSGAFRLFGRATASALSSAALNDARPTVVTMDIPSNRKHVKVDRKTDKASLRSMKKARRRRASKGETNAVVAVVRSNSNVKNVALLESYQ